MSSGEIALYIILVIAVNAAILKVLLSTKTWNGVKGLLAFAVAVPALAMIVSRFLLVDVSPVLRHLPITFAFGITGQILMFFFRNLVLVKMREVRAKAFGQKLAPSQGFANDYLLHIPQMRTEALIVFTIVTVFEVWMLLQPIL